ncbi:unnamed protein product, partial [Staurois parvus]
CPIVGVRGGRNSVPSLVSVGGIVWWGGDSAPSFGSGGGRNSAPSLVSVGGIVSHLWCQWGGGIVPHRWCQ